MKGRARGVLSGRLRYFIVVALGAVIGGLLGLLFGKRAGGQSFAGGFAHSFPGSFSPSDLASAFFWQFAPLAMLWYAACGALFRPTAVLLLSIRSVLGGYVALFAWRIFFAEDRLTLLLLAFFSLFELTALALFAAFSHRAEAFSALVMKKGLRKRALCRFSSDLLFYYGLILFFYIGRGCVVALLNT